MYISSSARGRGHDYFLSPSRLAKVPRYLLIHILPRETNIYFASILVQNVSKLNTCNDVDSIRRFRCRSKDEDSTCFETKQK